MREHDAVAGPNDCLGVKLVGKAEAWPEVLVIVVSRSGAIAGAGARSCVGQRAVEASNRVGQGGIEEALRVVHFGDSWIEVIAQAKVDGELAGHLPVVLNVGRDGTEARTEFLLQILREA